MKLYQFYILVKQKMAVYSFFKEFFNEKITKYLSYSNYKYIFAPQKCNGEIAQLVRAHDS